MPSYERFGYQFQSNLHFGYPSVRTFHSSIVPDIILEFSLINNLDSRIRDAPVLRPFVYILPLINNRVSRIREDPVLHLVPLLQND